MSISIKDVAVSAGTSRGTVSKVLNNVSGFQISEEKRQRITQAARDLGYHPNQSARALGRGKSDTIGLVIFGLRNPFFAEVADIVEDLALKAGYRAIIEVTPPVEERRLTHGKLAGWQLDGMLVWGGTTEIPGYSDCAQPIKCPIVFLGDERDDGKDWVAYDLYDNGKVAANHILDAGYKKPWFVTPFPQLSTGARDWRVGAYEDVCRDRDVDSHVFVLPRLEESRKIGLEAGLEIAALPESRRPDALLCHNDLIAVGVYHGILRAGLRIPQDIAVMGHDGIDEGKYLDKPLTTIVAENEILCKTALDILLRRITGDADSLAYGVKLRGDLFLGGTT